MYAPNFSELAAVSVRRLAWAMDVSMPVAVNIMVKLTPCYLNCQKVCLLCKDKTKCEKCIFKKSEQKDAFMNLPFTEKEQTAFMAVQ